MFKESVIGQKKLCCFYVRLSGFFHCINQSHKFFRSVSDGNVVMFSFRNQTDRLVLRRYVDEDAAAMYKNWSSDKEVTKFLTWPTHSSQEISQSVIEDWVKQYSNESYYH